MPPPTATSAPSATTNAGGSSSMAPVAAVVGLGGLGAAYLYFSSGNEEKILPSASRATIAPKEETKKAEQSEKVTETMSDKDSEDSKPVEEEVSDVVETSAPATQTPPETTEQPSSVVTEDAVSSATMRMDDTSQTTKAIDALDSRGMSEEDAASLVASHQSLWSGAQIAELESMAVPELKARILQLKAELQDRTKWEAVRLKEFLTMKEKEVAAEFAQKMHQQKLEFEELMAKKLSDKEYEKTQLMQNELLRKDASIQQILNTALEAAKREHDADKKAFEEQIQAQLQVKLDDMYGEKFEEFKAQSAADMEGKVATLQSLQAKVVELEDALASSQTSQMGSTKAHRLSAAALALGEKLSTGEPAGAELESLQLAAGRDGVICTALKTIPAGVQDQGVPTITTLQARFEDLYERAREASLVPVGRRGLEGQLAGMVLSKLKMAPLPDDVAPDTSSSEHILARTRQHVQAGDLDAALEQLDSLKKGQAYFTIADWKRDCLDRIAVEKALKVIKLECALLNESLA